MRDTRTEGQVAKLRESPVGKENLRRGEFGTGGMAAGKNEFSASANLAKCEL
jgi:hypothetical protein